MKVYGPGRWDLVLGAGFASARTRGEAEGRAGGRAEGRAG